MKGRTAFRIAWSGPLGLFGLTAALAVSALVLSLGGGRGWNPVGSFPVTIGFAGVGALVAARTSNKVGWLFLAEGLALALATGAKEYAARTGAASLPGAPWAGWILTITLNAIFPLLLLALLLFPDGRLPSPRWRLVAWAAVAAGAVGMACVAVSDVNFSSNFPKLADPVTIVRAASLRGIYNGTLVAGPLIFLACAASLVVRLIRSRGEQRLQLKWFVYASALAATAVAIATFLLPDPGFAFAAFVTLMPIGAGVAIFKCRLYDIDVVINKTVVFGGPRRVHHHGVRGHRGGHRGGHRPGVQAEPRPVDPGHGRGGRRLPAGPGTRPAPRQPLGVRSPDHALRGAVGVLLKDGRLL